MTFDDFETESESILSYIEGHWESLRANARFGHADSIDSWREMAAFSHDGHLDDQDHSNPYILYLPNDFVTPGGRFVVQFYWDCYFIILGLLKCGRVELAKGMVDNCLYLVRKHGMVIANRKRWSAGSQLPFLSKMVGEIFAVTGDMKWLTEAIPIIEQEYWGHWLNREHQVYRGLSRYHAPPWFPAAAIPEITMDHEATWDLSPRFDRNDILSLLPVDLNSNLYGYEQDLAFFMQLTGNASSAEKWVVRAIERQRVINELNWDKSDGLYLDFNFQKNQTKLVKSLATFFPLFVNLATDEQAAQVASKLDIFEHSFGLSTCDNDYGYKDRQWNFPIGWAPLHWIVYTGLKNYGYIEHAKRIAIKWLTVNQQEWIRTGRLFEKYDVVSGSSDVLTDRYKNQSGFGWTNGVYLALVHELKMLRSVAKEPNGSSYSKRN